MSYQFSKEALAAMEAENPQVAKVDIFLADGTLLEVFYDDLAYNGLQFTGQMLASSDFVPGGVTSQRVTVILNNVGHKFDDFVFDGAILIPYIATKPLKGDSVEWRRMGLYYVTDPSDSDGESISLGAYDGIYNTAKTYDGGITFPATLGDIALYCCQKSGLTLSTPDFSFCDFVVTRAVDLGDSTHQQILSYVAAISGHYVTCNELGGVEFRWLHDTEKEITTKKIFSPYRANKDDIQITGCKVKASGTEIDYGETVLIGEEGYVISISDNPLVVENTAKQVAEHLASRLNGLRFRPVTSLSIIPDISIDIGDGITFSGDQIPGKRIYSYVTNYSFTINEAASISCKAKSAAIMAHQGFSGNARVEAKQKEIVNQALNGYDTQTKNSNALSANILGFFYSKTEDVSGKVVSYWHDREQVTLSNVIYKYDGGFYVSTDGGENYVKGFDDSGAPTLNILQAIGINPEWLSSMIDPSKVKATEDSTLADFISLLLSAIAIKNGKLEVDAEIVFKNKQYNFESPVYVNEYNHLVFM